MACYICFLNFNLKEGNVYILQCIQQTVFMGIWHQKASENLLLSLYRLFFPISINRFLKNIPYKQDSTYHGLCYTSYGLEQDFIYYLKTAVC